MDIITDGPVLVLTGAFDVRSTRDVRQALQAQLEDFPEVVVDLSDVEYADVLALRVLAAASLQAGKYGGHVTLRGCGPSVRRMLHKSHLIRVVEVERAAASA